MRRPTTITGAIVALLLTLVPAGASPGRDAEATAPLLEAMAYVDPASEAVGLEFVDWGQLKDVHGGAAITSASPLPERQRLLLDFARSETLPFSLGLDRLASWAPAWGWDVTDLEWQARYLHLPGGAPADSVLRFGEHWDVETFRQALRGWGYERDGDGDIELWFPPPEAMPSELHLERLAGGGYEGPDMSQTHAVVAIDPDGRTVVIREFEGDVPPRQLRSASRPHPGRMADHPATRAAAALDRPLVADVQASGSDRFLCAWPSEAGPLEGDPETSAIVDELHAYAARANGYRRADPRAPALGRHVFAYDDPRMARADLEGRSELVAAGVRAGVVSLTSAHVEGRELVLDVESVSGHPDVGLVGPRFAWAPFVMCGSG